MEPKTEDKEKKAFILTNGFFDFGHNYIKMFHNKIQAKKYASSMGLNFVKHLHEISIPSNKKLPINIIIRKVNTYGQITENTAISLVDSYNDFSDIALNYYKSQHSEHLHEYNLLKIKTSLLFQNEKTIFQMFGNNGYDSMCYISNVNYEEQPRQ
jgi:hypothetical protein